MSAWLAVITHPIYLAACLLIGIAGRKRRPGLFGSALLALLLTPVVMILAFFIGAERREPTEADPS